MTPPEHFLIGISCAHIFYCIQSFLKKNIFSYLLLFFILGLVATSPDIDSFFGAYMSTDPYKGHRGITHSFLGVAVIALIFTFAVAVMLIVIKIHWMLIRDIFRKKKTEKSDNSYIKDMFGIINPRYLLIFFIMLFVAGTTHLLADLPQPPGVWHGIPLFFPLKENGQYIRNGGWSLIGWYDLKILWLLLQTTIISIVIIIGAKILRNLKVTKIAGFLFILIILLNCVMFSWMSTYIRSHPYEGDKQWNSYQVRVVENFPPAVKKAVYDGKNIFLNLFHKVVK